MIIKVETKTGDTFVDGISETIMGIEEEVRERVEDAIRALDRHELDERGDYPVLSVARGGDWLAFDDVMDAVKRGNWG